MTTDNTTPPGDNAPDPLADELLDVYNQLYPSDPPSLDEPLPMGSENVEELDAILPDYEMIALLEGGDMGTVYKARQRRLNRPVAIKVLPAGVTSEPGFAARFFREAGTLARLNHQNIATVHDFGQAGRLFYIVMEFIEGASLAQLLARRAIGSSQALAVVRQICDAVEYAHDAQVVARDLKPSNIFVDSKGRVKITDFGIADLLRHEPDSLSSAEQPGGLSCMALERCSDSDHVNERADICSLAVILYELLTGELPIGPPSRCFNVDIKLDEIVLKALDAKTERHYQHAG